MSNIANQNRDTSTGAEGGVPVLSIQERIRAMNETLDSVEQRQKKEHQPAKSKNMENATKDLEGTAGIQNENGDHLISLPPVMKRSSVIDIWRMRENQNATAVTNTGMATTTTARKGTILSASKTIAPSIESLNIRISQDGADNGSSSVSPVRVDRSGMADPWKSKSSEGQEEKKEDMDNFDVSPVGIGVPIRTVATASPTPPALLGVNRKNQDVLSTSSKVSHHHVLSQQKQLASNNNSYPVVDLTIVQSTSSLSTSSGRQHFVSRNPSFSTPNNDNTICKDTTMREKILKNTTTTTTVTTTSNSVPSTCFGSSANNDIQQRPSYDEKDEQKEKTENGIPLTAPQSPNRNTNVADRWARRYINQKGTAPTISDALVTTKLTLPSSETRTLSCGETAKGIDDFGMGPMNTCSTDLPKTHKSTESDSGIAFSPHQIERKGKITDRYKATGTSTALPPINHKVSPMISSLVKEHAARTPVLTYKNKKGNMTEISALEASITNSKTPSASLETQANDSDMIISTDGSNIAVVPVDKQAEKRRSKISDRWTVNNNTVGAFKGKDTSDIPAIYGKVTDRYNPKGKSSASEPGVRRFDNASVAELLKVHAGKTPAGKVRGGFKQHATDAQQKSIRNIPLASDTCNTDLTSESKVATPKPPSNVADRWTSRQPRITNIQEHDDDELKVLPSKVKEQRKTKLYPSQESDTADPSLVVTSDEIGSTLGFTPMIRNIPGTADPWDKPVKVNFKNGEETKKIPTTTSPNDDIRPLMGQKVSNAGSDLPNPDKLIDSVTGSVLVNEGETTNETDLSHTVVSSAFINPPQQVNVNDEDRQISLPRQTDDNLGKLRNPSAFDSWNVHDKVSHFHGRNNTTCATLPTLLAPSNVGISESIAPPFTQGDDSIPSLLQSFARSNELDDRKSTCHIEDTMVDDVSDAADRVQNPGKYPSLNTAATISLSTKKLASDRASNKKRLQQYRGKVKKTLSSKLESLRMGDAEDDSSKSTTKRPDGSLGHAARVPPAAVKPTFNINDMLQSSGYEAGQSSKPEKSDVDKETINTIGSSASTTSSSPLASKAEKVLQDRRRRSKSNKYPLQAAHPTEFSTRPQSNQGLVDEEPITCDRNGYFCHDQPRLPSRYNTSARFLEADTLNSAPVAAAYDSGSVDSSCHESGTTSGSNSGYGQEGRRIMQEKKNISRRRKHGLKDPPGQCSKNKSLNHSSHSNWDSDWGGNGSMVAMDFDKFVSVVDEQVAAFRDFVEGITQVKGKQKPRQPPNANAPLDIEDVAIEVEYVEDSFDEDDPKADLGLCAAPVDKMVRESLDFSDGSKEKAWGDFQLSCNDMLPTGEPSCEQKPYARKQNKRNSYV